MITTATELMDAYSGLPSTEQKKFNTRFKHFQRFANTLELAANGKLVLIQKSDDLKTITLSCVGPLNGKTFQCNKQGLKLAATVIQEGGFKKYIVI